MTRKKLSNEHVKNIVESEGLGYAVQHYMNGDEIADPELVQLWDAARDALQELDDFLENIDELEDDDTD